MKLYRGFVDDINLGVVKNYYRTTPRKPKDTHENIHHVADRWFEKTFGIKARSGTIFCSTDIDQAQSYGKVFEVSFPEGVEYKLLFSRKVVDFAEIMFDDANAKFDLSDSCNAGIIIEWLESKQYQVVSCINELPREFLGEVMVDCEAYSVIEFQR